MHGCALFLSQGFCGFEFDAKPPWQRRMQKKGGWNLVARQQACLRVQWERDGARASEEMGRLRIAGSQPGCLTVGGMSFKFYSCQGASFGKALFQRHYVRQCLCHRDTNSVPSSPVQHCPRGMHCAICFTTAFIKWGRMKGKHFFKSYGLVLSRECHKVL